MIPLKTKDDIERMREAARIVVELLDCLKAHVRPGVATAELDRIAADFIMKKKAMPAFKGYKGYPAVICASVNDQVVHGIPNSKKLADGDILSVDVGVLYKDFYGDSARTYPVGKIGRQAAELLKVTEEALYKGIGNANPSGRLSDIGHAVEIHVKAAGFDVVRDFVGHGIGRQMHEEPQIPNFGPPGMGVELKEGMVLAIEPMVNAGSYEVELLEDGWTVVTKDGSLSAHFEHTVAVTADGPDVLTRI